MAVVNGPVTVLILGGLATAVIIGQRLELTGWVALASIFAPIAVGWLWWSFALPRWRVWALERVEDWDELIDQAVTYGLMWPPGHSFEKTEIKPQRIREREREVGW